MYRFWILLFLFALAGCTSSGYHRPGYIISQDETLLPSAKEEEQVR